MVASNLNLLNRILESNSALSNHASADWSATGQTDAAASVPTVKDEVS